MIALTVVLAVFVGIALGLLGGGGSILTVPLLAYVAGMEAKQAIATSLLVVGTTSVVAAVSHARAGRVQWRTGLMVATAIAMLRGRKDVGPADPGHRIPVLKVIAEGLVVGLVTGLVGAGGGFLVVPALALLGGLPMPIAVGTSLVVIAMKSFAGFAGYLTSVTIDWRLAGMVTAAAVVGALVGARLTALVNPDSLRKAFGWFVLVMSSVILFEEVHPALGMAMVAVTIVAAVVYSVRGRRSSDTPAGTLDTVKS
jgi:uncharacterized membrane protein YfcA